MWTNSRSGLFHYISKWSKHDKQTNSRSQTLCKWMCLLVYKCPDDSQRVQHQAIHILLLPPGLMGSSSSARRSDWVPRSTTPSLPSIHNYSCTMVHPSSLPSSCPWWSMLMILQVTILTTYTAVTHGSCTGDHRSKGLPDCRSWIWKRKVE